MVNVFGEAKVATTETSSGGRERRGKDSLRRGLDLERTLRIAERMVGWYFLRFMAVCASLLVIGENVYIYIYLCTSVTPTNNPRGQQKNDKYHITLLGVDFVISAVIG